MDNSSTDEKIMDKQVEDVERLDTYIDPKAEKKLLLKME